MVASRRSTRLILLGLTGPIAGGKSTVARLLAAHGADVIDCDQLAREAVAPGSATLAAITRYFGDAVRLPDGGLDRAALARIVFSDPVQLGVLEHLVHPAVTAMLQERLAACRAPVAVIEAIKLVEAGYAADCDEVWVVTASPAVRRQRLVASRGLDAAAAQQRIEAQTNLPAMLAAADRVLVNDGTPAELATEVDRLWHALVAP